ncbi:MAG: hypothetical protein ACRCX8_04610 [Sarcina sp.]
MFDFKEFIEVVEKRDLYEFNQLTNKCGEEIFDYLKEIRKDFDTEVLYFEVLTELWGETTETLKGIERFKDYIALKQEKFKTRPKNFLDQKVKSFTSFSSPGINIFQIKKRKNIYRNEFVINYIMISDFKSQLAVEKFNFEKIVSLDMNMFAPIGPIYNDVNYTDFAYFIYLISDDKIYLEPLTKEYKKIEYKEAYLEYDMNLLSRIAVKDSEKTMYIDKEFILEFSDGKELHLFKGPCLEARAIKNYFLNVSKAKKIDIVDIK